MSKKEFLIVLAITLIVIVVWFFAERQYSQPNVTVDPRLEKALTPLDANFDKSTLDKISSVSNPHPLVDTPTITITTQASPTPQPTTRVATSSATQAPTATNSATINSP